LSVEQRDFGGNELPRQVLLDQDAAGGLLAQLGGDSRGRGQDLFRCLEQLFRTVGSVGHHAVHAARRFGNNRVAEVAGYLDGCRNAGCNGMARGHESRPLDQVPR
jgi:hypothetical protein